MHTGDAAHCVHVWELRFIFVWTPTYTLIILLELGTTNPLLHVLLNTIDDKRVKVSKQATRMKLEPYFAVFCH
jgi:hypothetical protein